MHACEYGCDTPYEELVVSIEEVTHATEKLDLNKACVSDGICSEHLKYASNVLVPLLAMCFTSFMSHGFLPDSMLSVMLVPVIKDKAGKISSKDNYRPIALTSVISKLVEVIMLDRIEMYMITNPNQFGFKRKHGTDQCIYVLKEIIDLNRKLNPYSADFFYFVHFDISCCLGISRKGSILLFDLFRVFFKQGAKSQTSH